MRRLTVFGLKGLEAFYATYTPQLREQVLTLADRYGLYVTAGSDYHGGNKRIALGDTGLDGGWAMPDGMARFLEKLGVG